MKYTVTGKQMKGIDQDTIQRIGIPSVVLMERAALAVADAAEGLLKKAKRQSGVRIVAVCGTGNNGADGIAAGRILRGRGYDVAIFLAGDSEHGTEEYQLQRRIAQEVGISMRPAAELTLCGSEIVLDALFGIGLGRRIEGEYQKLIEKINQRQDVDIVAVDIPSGIHGDTGAVMGVACRAAVTVTFGYMKSGLLLYPGREYAGKVLVEDIGFFDGSREQVGWDAAVLEREDMDRLPKRPPDSNKGTFGKLLVVAGSIGMSGAAYLSALGAYRTGTGLVRILTVSENRAVLQTLLPEAMVDVLEIPKGAFGREEGDRPEALSHNPEWENLCQAVKECCAWADGIVIGPGLGQAPYVEKLVEAVLVSTEVPVVMDADGLNAVARLPRLTKFFPGRVIVTPHMGEMARLAGQPIAALKADRLRAAREYAARTGAVCVLKDASTVIADPEGLAWINTSGSSAMAKGGSGDVLSGVIGSLLVQGMMRTEAAAWGVYLHGLAGEKAAKRQGERAVMARELAKALAF